MDRIKYQHVNQEDEAAKLWEDTIGESRVDWFKEKIVPHEKSVFFGYADVTLVLQTEHRVKFPLKLRGIGVKFLKGQARLDMPAKKGGDGEYYDIFMPRSAALRSVLTTLIFADQEVRATIARASTAPAVTAQPTAAPVSAVPAAVPTFSEGNPFRS